MKNKFTFLYLAWIVATVSTAGSFFLSHFMELPPCSLCWYQRICMFPLVAVLAVGLAVEDVKAHLYAMPLVVLGGVIALYHNLLYYKWIAEPLVPCTGGVSCTEKQLELFGFVSIPLMSLVSFLVLFILVLAQIKSQRGKA